MLMAFFAMTAAQAQTDKRSQTTETTTAKKDKTMVEKDRMTNGQQPATAKKASKKNKMAKTATDKSNDGIISDPDTGNGTGTGGNASVPGSGNGTNSGGVGAGVKTETTGNGVPGK